MPNIELTYFEGAGRAEPVRIALRLAGLPFTDTRLKFPEFAEKKAAGAFPLGSLPVLSVDGVAYPQTAAMLRWVARTAAPWLYPTDPTAALAVDSVLDSFNDTLSHALTPSLFERDMAKKLAMRAELAKGPMARVLGFTEKTLARTGGPFVGGKEISIADLVIAQQVLQIRAGKLDGITSDYLAEYPRIVALTDAYLADPRVKALG